MEILRARQGNKKEKRVHATRSEWKRERERETELEKGDLENSYTKDKHPALYCYIGWERED